MIGVGIAGGLTQMQKKVLEEVNDPDFEKKSAMNPYLASFLVATPLSYYGSAKAELKARQGRPLDNIEETVRKHPLPTAFLSALAGGKLLKGMRGSVSAAKGSAGKGLNFFNKKAELQPETINLIYKELITTS